MNGSVEHRYAEWRFTALWELFGGEALWEVAYGAHSFFPEADEEARATLEERLLRELWSEGWARFVRRSESRPLEQELDADEVEAVIRSRVWRNQPLGGDALDVIIEPREKAVAWHASHEAGSPEEPQPPTRPA